MHCLLTRPLLQKMFCFVLFFLFWWHHGSKSKKIQLGAAFLVDVTSVTLHLYFSIFLPSARLRALGLRSLFCKSSTRRPGAFWVGWCLIWHVRSLVTTNFILNHQWQQSSLKVPEWIVSLPHGPPQVLWLVMSVRPGKHGYRCGFPMQLSEFASFSPPGLYQLQLFTLQGDRPDVYAEMTEWLLVFRVGFVRLPLWWLHVQVEFSWMVTFTVIHPQQIAEQLVWSCLLVESSLVSCHHRYADVSFEALFFNEQFWDLWVSIWRIAASSIPSCGDISHHWWVGE